jgi:very-short-patch-repair endonuclease
MVRMVKGQLDTKGVCPTLDGFARSFKALRLPEPVQELRFHPTRRWRFDYAWPEVMVAVEKEGGVWRRGGGAHSRPTNIARDIEKQTAAALLGWTVLRYQPRDLLKKLPEIADMLRRRLAAINRGEGNASTEA